MILEKNEIWWEIDFFRKNRLIFEISSIHWKIDDFSSIFSKVCLHSKPCKILSFWLLRAVKISTDRWEAALNKCRLETAPKSFQNDLAGFWWKNKLFYCFFSALSENIRFFYCFRTSWTEFCLYVTIFLMYFMIYNGAI